MSLSQEDKTLNKELRRGTLELAILAILARSDIYGYELASMLAAESDGCLAVKEHFTCGRTLNSDRW